MTRLDFDPDLERLGVALRDSTTIDLAREEQAARPTGVGRGRHAGAGPATRAPRTRPGSRVLAGGTLGLAGVGAALVLALSGSSAPPAYAVTRNGDGSVLVQINQLQSLPVANRKLTAMGIHEQIAIQMATGPATVGGPVNCVPSPPGANLPGPPVKAVVGTSGTEVIPSGNTGAGTWHVAACHLYSTRTTRGNPLYSENPGAWGNTGAG
jgi:hypothetical protein